MLILNGDIIDGSGLAFVFVAKKGFVLHQAT